LREDCRRLADRWLSNGWTLTMGIAQVTQGGSPIPAGAGIGLRFPHHEAVAALRPAVAFLEVHAENYFGGGRVRECLADLRRDYPLSVHGVGLSLGSAGDLDQRHLALLAALVQNFQPALVSEHLSWSITNGRYLADLLPLPMTEEALQVVCRHVSQVQERLGRPILIENPSTYVQFEHSSIPEWEFIAELAARTGCGMLCDVNNIFVSASNHGWDPQRYIDALPSRIVGEIHLAGHAVRTLPDGARVRIDTHGSRVCPEVWTLYRHALDRFGPRPTLIEWDTDIPPLPTLLDEADIAAVALAARYAANTQTEASHALAG
jgi:hypothetical protein